MEITAETLILVGVICVILGFLASMLLATLRDEAEEPVPGAPEAPPGGQKGRYTPVARLWRENGTERLVVEVDGKSLVTTEPLGQAERARLEQAARDLRAWLGMGLAEPAPAVPAAPAPAAPAEIFDQPAARAHFIAPAPDDADAPVAPVDLLRSAWLEAEPEQEPQPVPMRAAAPARVTGPLSPAGSPRAARAVVIDEPAPLPSSAGKSIVMQIEDVLQDMLYGSPLRSRGIHLNEDPIRGVLVSLDGKYYEGIDAVPDPEVKAFIRSAVETWEKSQ